MVLRNSLIAAVGLAMGVGAMSGDANAYEFGFAGSAQKPGITFGGSSAAAPPPGVYMFEQFFDYQAKIVGPGAPNVGGKQTTVSAASPIVGLLWVPGWTILGATYNAVIVQPWVFTDIGAPIDVGYAGGHNTYVAPIELSWRFGDSGFFAKTGLGMYVPSGTQTGVNGLGNSGAPWWTFQPELIVSYLKDGWNLTANIFAEFNTKNTVTGYTSGDVFHAEFTATKRIDKWTLGPVAYYVGQISNDKSSAFYGGAINVNKYDIWAVGGLVGYDFGPVALNVWALNEVSAHASGGTPIAGLDSASVAKGWTVYAQLSYRLWGPEAPAAPKVPMFRK